MDQRMEQLAKGLVHYSCKVQPGEKVMIHFFGQDTVDLARCIIKEVYKVGGLPFPKFVNAKIQREILLECSKEQLEIMAQVDVLEMSKMDCYIAIRGSENVSEYSDVDSEHMRLYNELYNEPVHGKVRVPKTRWVVLRYPNASMAQLSNMSTEAFENFYYQVCNLDYSKMGKAMENLVSYMEKTDKVRIVGPGCDLRFSIKDIPVIPCAGTMNIPDGEVFTAPVKDSVEGIITYNTPSVYMGNSYENISFTFEKGKIVKAVANHTEKINAVLDSDEGARYIGEFAIGVNPYVLDPMKDTLFDEKICGSIHFTPGSSYDEAPNGNKSVIHWDLVLIQRPEYGGGEIYFDDVLIRKDGRFVVKELECLNPENLV